MRLGIRFFVLYIGNWVAAFLGLDSGWNRQVGNMDKELSSPDLEPLQPASCLLVPGEDT